MHRVSDRKLRTRLVIQEAIAIGSFKKMTISNNFVKSDMKQILIIFRHDPRSILRKTGFTEFIDRLKRNRSDIENNYRSFVF